MSQQKAHFYDKNYFSVRVSGVIDVRRIIQIILNIMIMICSGCGNS